MLIKSIEPNKIKASLYQRKERMDNSCHIPMSNLLQEFFLKIKISKSGYSIYFICFGPHFKIDINLFFRIGI